ncbi:hydroxypyruvate isomerase family protein [Albidovulum sediminicola]|uniref:TIM barrel protein n=1 Tax=Albidovulum sediminicola TaxID=2984331 RepID=A0ABT2Z4J9_9RHOB|nr:TIM barrel protein [Defluviimonas sp. WL0075]MCV2865985.1 TIM barrel protein [Defluviimonas sp. WL0075]
MPRFAANLTWLFQELPFMERFRAAKDAGFEGVEVLFPYDHPTQDMRDQLIFSRLSFVLMNCPPPNATGGPQGFAAVPGVEARFRRDFDRTLRFAQVLKPLHIHIMAGAAEGPEAEAVFIENLRWAVARAPRQSLTIEPINRIDMPGYFLADYDTAARVLDAVAAPNLALQFDAYHAHRITGDVMGTWAAHGHRARHVQVAGFPGRHEPLGGEIDYPAFFARLDADGYTGWVSGEYAPETVTGAGLAWIG